MCKSVKGAAYFGSSIHVVAAFIFLFWFLFDTVITEVHINLWRCPPTDDDPPRQYNALVHYLNLPFKFLYYMCLCVTGIYIFRGVERDSPRVIKFALLVFVILQIVAISLFITISLNYWETEDESTPVAARLVNDNPHLSPPSPDQYYYDEDSVGSLESLGDYSVNIEVISHPPEGLKPPLTRLQLQSEENASQKSASSGPENLMLESLVKADQNFTDPEELEETTRKARPTTEPPFYIGSSEILRSLSAQSLSSQPELLEEEGMIMAQGESTGESDKDETQTGLSPTSPSQGSQESGAVLESPLDPSGLPTTPSTSVDSTQEEVVVIKVMKGGNSQMRKLSHNQLVSVVFQVFLVGFNAVGSFIYVGVLLIHLTSL